MNKCIHIHTQWKLILCLTYTTQVGHSDCELLRTGGGGGGDGGVVVEIDPHTTPHHTRRQRIQSRQLGLEF